jgi:NitT/TauT family transport system ATP-binding protein
MQLSPTPPTRRPLVQAVSVRKTFATRDGELPVLDGIDLTISEGEIVCLLGKSGSGKSTLLRCIAGLVAPSEGSVSYRGKPLVGTNPGAALVFQTFALLPWLTVQQNVELGLEARGVGPQERAQGAIRAIDRIGLDGFESAYPKELSGGMRQRVGFARALVVEPDLLLMDEPFSALDVLTAENLRTELLELWQAGDFPTRAILMVTHNIEEAVLCSDRVIILGTNPGRLRAEIAIDLERPRDRRDPAFEALVDQIYGIRLPLADAAVLPSFVTIHDGEIGLTESGTQFAGADIQASKNMFHQAALRVPLVRMIRLALKRSEDGGLREGFFIDLLRRHYSVEEARAQLESAINWGRYAELYAYDASRRELTLDTQAGFGA